MVDVVERHRVHDVEPFQVDSVVDLLQGGRFAFQDYSFYLWVFQDLPDSLACLQKMQKVVDCEKFNEEDDDLFVFEDVFISNQTVLVHKLRKKQLQ